MPRLLPELHCSWYSTGLDDTQSELHFHPILLNIVVCCDIILMWYWLHYLILYFLATNYVLSAVFVYIVFLFVNVYTIIV